MTLFQQKQELRQLFREKRLALSIKKHQALSSSLSRLLRQVLKPFQPQVIAGYWPVYGEVNIQPLLAEWHQNGWTVCLPAINPDPQQKPSLLFRAWSPHTICYPSRFNIPEPPADASLCAPSILCIPCLAFDRQGYRLGYGKGHYDDYSEYIKDHQSFCLRIGIAFSFQEYPHLPHGKHDYPMNLIVTEEEIIEPVEQFS